MERLTCPVCNTDKGGAFVPWNGDFVHVDCIEEDEE